MPSSRRDWPSSGANSGCVALLDDNCREWFCSASPVRCRKRAATWQHFPLAQAIREGEVVLSLDDNGAMIALPMIVRGEAIGSLGWGWAADRSFGDEDRSFLGTLAELCGQAPTCALPLCRRRAARERAERETEATPPGQRGRPADRGRESEERLRTLSEKLPARGHLPDHGRCGRPAAGRLTSVPASMAPARRPGRRNPGRPRRHVRPGPRGGPWPRGRPGRGPLGSLPPSTASSARGLALGPGCAGSTQNSALRCLPTGEAVWEGIVLDVTDRKQAEEALHRERALLEAIVYRISVDADGVQARHTARAAQPGFPAGRRLVGPGRGGHLADGAVLPRPRLPGARPPSSCRRAGTAGWTSA